MSSTSSSQSLVDRASNFVSENRRAILLGTAVAVVAVGGIAYYSSTAPSSKKNGRKPRDASKSKPKRKTVEDDDGPILEEIIAPEKGSFVQLKILCSNVDGDTTGEQALTLEEITAMDGDVCNFLLVLNARLAKNNS